MRVDPCHAGTELLRRRSFAAPTLVSLIKSDAQRDALAFFLAREQLGRPFVAPPDVPEERVQALRRAFDATMKDREFMSDAQKQEFNVVAMTGEQIATLMGRIYQTPEEVVRLTAKALGRELK